LEDGDLGEPAVLPTFTRNLFCIFSVNNRIRDSTGYKGLDSLVNEVSPALSNDGHFEFLTVIKSIPVIGRVPNGVRFVPIISSLIH
jgi:hypothetical protein